MSVFTLGQVKKLQPSPAEDMARSEGDRRSEPRRGVRRALIAVPVLPEGSPDWDRRADGMSIDVCGEGLGLQLFSQVDFRTARHVVLFPDPVTDICSATLEIRYRQPGGVGVLRAGGLIRDLTGDSLLGYNLKPSFHKEKMEFSLDAPEDVLRKWADIGVLRPVLLDRVQLCPSCHGLPTFRPGCACCGSVRTTHDHLIHHFACAYVGRLQEFETDNGLICPKCRTPSLVVNSDYEHIPGPYRCLDCHWSDVILDQVGDCLRCGLRFPIHQAYLQDLRGYRANRLDPQTLGEQCPR